METVAYYQYKKCLVVKNFVFHFHYQCLRMFSLMCITF
jgi:hypothetical protein